MADAAEVKQKFTYDSVVDAAEYLKSTLKGFRPRIGIICGSGLGALTDLVDQRSMPAVPFSDLPNFAHFKSGVAGHSGKFLFGFLHNVEVMVSVGRIHPYEGNSCLECCLPVFIMRKLGVTHVILTNAAGSMNRNMKVGSLVLIKDHIDIPGLCGDNPLYGVNDSRFFSNEFGPGSRFVAVANCYDPKLLETTMNVATNLLKWTSEEINQGIYCRIAGPYYETTAEVALLRKCFEGDVVGMSTTYEALVAFQCSMKVLGITVVTDSTDEVDSVSHEQVLAAGVKAATRLAALVSKLIETEFVQEAPAHGSAEEEVQG